MLPDNLVKVIEETKNLTEAAREVGNLAKEIANVCNRLCIACMTEPDIGWALTQQYLGDCGNPRVVWLAYHAKRYRARKKNHNRAMNLIRRQQRENRTH